MAEWKSSYTTEEDAVVLAYCKEAEEEGVAWSTAYLKIAEVLQRPVGSVHNRHTRLRKALEKGNSKNKVGISDGELLVAKLKSLAHEKKRNAEKSEMWKERYEELNRKHEQLEKKHNKLQSEHQLLINTVKEALGEETTVVQQEIEVS